MYFYFSTALLVKGEHIIAFMKTGEEKIRDALTDLAADPDSSSHLAHTVGLLVGMMAAATGHRKCVFLGMTVKDINSAQQYGSTFTFTVSFFLFVCLFLMMELDYLESKESFPELEPTGLIILSFDMYG